MDNAATATELVADRPAPVFLTLLLAATCGLIVANLYYAQPLIGPIAASLGLPPSAAGLIVTLTQIGYGAGLLFVVPLGDLLENRRLVLVLIGITTLALLAGAMSVHPAPFLAAALIIGASSVAVQVLVAYGAHLATDATRGRVVGNIMSGLMFGIMLARPGASFIAQFSSWHMVFYFSAAVMVVLGVILSIALPPRHPAARMHYGQLLGSMATLARTMPVLQQRALYHACLFGAFSLFWTTTPLLLASPAFGLSQAGIALFALAGVGGALVAPLAGHLADKGWSGAATAGAMLAGIAAFAITHLAPAGSNLALGLLVAAAILLDGGVTVHMIVSQRAIFALGAEFRARLNGLFMAIFFLGGAAGSALGAWAYATGGWTLTSAFGLALPLIALGFFALHHRHAIAAKS